MDFPDTSAVTEGPEREHLAHAVAVHAAAVEGLVAEAVRIKSAPFTAAALRTDPKRNPRWAYGELAKAAGSDHLAKFAEALGEKLTTVREWVETVEQWPDPPTRVAPWQVHAILRNHTGRFSLIRANLTIAQAKRLAPPARPAKGVKAKVDKIHEWLGNDAVWTEWTRRRRSEREVTVERQISEDRQAAARARRNKTDDPVANGIWDMWQRGVTMVMHMETLREILEHDIEQLEAHVGRLQCPKVLYPDLQDLAQRYGNVGYDIVDLLEKLTARVSDGGEIVETIGNIVRARAELDRPSA